LNLASNKTIAQLHKSEIGKVYKFTDQVLASRLVAMGILPGSRVEVLGKAPLRGGLYLKVDNQRIALRFKEAQSIVVSI
jgi:ferrous iron transport protein A